MNSFELKPWEARGLLDGSITTLVRPVIPQPPDRGQCAIHMMDGFRWSDEQEFYSWDYCPFGKPGDRLWCVSESGEMLKIPKHPKSSPYMNPRLCIEVKAVRVEKLHGLRPSRTFSANLLHQDSKAKDLFLKNLEKWVSNIENGFMKKWDEDWPEYPWESSPWAWVGVVGVV